MRSRTGSTLCPSCGQLVGVNDAQCLSCGRKPRACGASPRPCAASACDLGFVPLVLWACGGLYLATLAADLEGHRDGADLSLGSPSIASLFLFGASGPVPVFRFGRWWTILSAAWLHGGASSTSSST